MNNNTFRQILLGLFIIVYLVVTIPLLLPYILFEKYIWKPHLRFNKKTKEEMK